MFTKLLNWLFCKNDNKVARSSDVSYENCTGQHTFMVESADDVTQSRASDIHYINDSDKYKMIYITAAPVRLSCVRSGDKFQPINSNKAVSFSFIVAPNDEYIISGFGSIKLWLEESDKLDGFKFLYESGRWFMSGFDLHAQSIFMKNKWWEVR